MIPLRLSRRGVLCAGLGALATAGQARSDDAPPGEALEITGAGPGPTIRIRQGGEVVARLVNRLDRPSALHFHGVRSLNAMDGVPGLTQDAVPPGGRFDYRLPVRDAGTFWYRPLPLDGSGPFGILVVEEASPPEVDRDIAFLLAGATTGAGTIFSLGGAPRQEIPLALNERIRLRLVNAAPSVAILAFGGFDPVIVAMDGQPVNEPFVPAGHRIDLPPGGRVDMMIDALAPIAGGAGIAVLGAGGIAEVLRLSLRPGSPARPAPLPPPAGLPANPLPAEIPLASARNLDLRLSEAPDAAIPHAPLASVPRNAAVTIGLANPATTPLAVHLHGHAFRLLHPFDDGWEPYWLDTVLVEPGQTARIGFVADNPGRWLVETRATGIDAGRRSDWLEVAG